MWGIFMAEPKCEYTKCNNIAALKKNGKYARYCCVTCNAYHLREKKDAKTNQMIPKCASEICNNLCVIGNSGRLRDYCSDKCQSDNRLANSKKTKRLQEFPPICQCGGCDEPVLMGKNGWNLYCSSSCAGCYAAGKSKRDITPPKCEYIGCENDAVPSKSKQNVSGYEWTRYCSEECREKQKVINQEKTFQKLYGVNRPSQDPTIFEKTQKSGKKLRDYTFISGHIVRVRGYEPLALSLLEKLNYTENNLIVDTKQMPKIWYKFVDNTRHRYHPDIFIPEENLIIEVKSTYTYNKYKDKNLLKKQACLDAGYNFEFMIFDDRGNLLENTE
jgi:hypothetical protein